MLNFVGILLANIEFDNQNVIVGLWFAVTVINGFVAQIFKS